MEEIRTGTASLDLVKKIITEEDSQTEKRFGPKEIVNQVATFFCGKRNKRLRSSMVALHLLALYPEWQDRLAAKAVGLRDDFSSISRLNQARAVFYEALCLYLPVG